MLENVKDPSVVGHKIKVTDFSDSNHQKIKRGS